MSDEDDYLDSLDWDEPCEAMAGDEGDNLSDLINEYIPLIQEMIGKDAVSIEYNNDDEDRWEFYVSQGINSVAGWAMTQLPGCCGVLVSCHMHTSYGYKKMGLGGLLIQFKEAVAARWGYSSLMLTDIANHAYPQSLVKNHGFKEINTFLNKRTGNKVGIYTKQIGD